MHNISVIIMKTKTALLLSILAGGATNLGIIFTYFKKDRVREVISISLAFAMGVMSLISLKELIPLPISYFIKNLNIGIALLIIFLIPVVALGIVKISKINIKKGSNLYKIGILNMLTLLLHNFPEGIIVFTSSIASQKLGLKLALSIGAHNLPEGICIALPIYYSTGNRKKAFIYTFISGIAEPFGAIITWLFLRSYISILFLNITLYFVGCLMLTISFLEILPEVLSYNRRFYILIGLFISLFILFF